VVHALWKVQNFVLLTAGTPKITAKVTYILGKVEMTRTHGLGRSCVGSQGLFEFSMFVEADEQVLTIGVTTGWAGPATPIDWFIVWHAHRTLVCCRR